MKTENTLENKSKFFAQYWGQTVATWNNNKSGLKPINLAYINDAGLFLELTPLEQITHEDAIELIKLKFKGDKGDLSDIISIKDVKIDSNRLNDVSISVVIEHKKWSDFIVRILINEETRTYYAIVDYLRSKGYAVNYLDLSVKDLIDYGWIKLK